MDTLPTAGAAPGSFAPVWRAPEPSRRRITDATRRSEAECVAHLLSIARPTPDSATAIATRLVEALRTRGRPRPVEGLMREYALSSQEGVALMCLAEALLRIPDAATRDKLIRDKIGGGHWHRHLGNSQSLFVNAATWGLLITGKLQDGAGEAGLQAALLRVLARGGEPLIRRAMDRAMRVLGEQFVMGETIGEALKRARPREAEGFRYSFDMLGEAALTESDAQAYLRSYQDAIRAIGAHNAERARRNKAPLPLRDAAGISVKLSALHPRYSRAQQERVRDELLPRLSELASLAREHNVGLNIDAEESDRLEISLDLVQSLCEQPDLAGWNGIGFVIQAYSRRTPAVIEHLIALGRRTGHRLMVRLVKGAYWDSEIKKAQEAGLSDYPVFTRKLHTDVSYLACARLLLDAPDAIFPQFATHNAQTVAAVMAIAAETPHDPDRYEFQCLYGMGEALYEQVVGANALDRPCRIYAPVGTHETLLAYLVRRLLENGANSSFVNRITDPEVPVSSLVGDPVQEAASAFPVGAPHAAIPAPAALFGVERRNAAGFDLASETELSVLSALMERGGETSFHAMPILAFDATPTESRACSDPSDRGRIVGTCADTDPADVPRAVSAAVASHPAWAATPSTERAAILSRAADQLETLMPSLLAPIMREAGKTAANSIGEVREAVDFLRYYAADARTLPDDGAALGPVLCISPWNFPLAIFTGQVAAALAAGNAVLCKPAEETPLIAACMVSILHEAGVPRGALQFLPGGGEIGAALVREPGVAGVMFTGSTEVARAINTALSERANGDSGAIPLIAETGGQNALIVDSAALPEQVVSDVVASGFDSAGQRCSALRVLCLQNETAPRVIAMLKGAMEQLRVGDATLLSTDVGPVITEDAREIIERHVARMEASGCRVTRFPLPSACAQGSFVAPTLIEIDRIDQLGAEVFGPVVHVLRFREDRLEATVDAVNATGYGLTFGVHTRIDDTVNRVVGRSEAGNLYVNRNLIGAVVGSQPFGGTGLSGTGPKAGGPLILHRLRRAEATHAILPGQAPDAAWRFLSLLDGHPSQPACLAILARSPFGVEKLLPGPVGERNEYALRPRGTVLCVADTEEDLLLQLAATLATGNRARVRARTGEMRAVTRALQALPDVLALETMASPAAAVLCGADALPGLARDLADAEGPLVPVFRCDAERSGFPLEWLMHERSLCTNTTAAGGNASLMTLD